MKEEVTLKFPYYDLIKYYLIETHTHSCTIIPSKDILRCTCSEEQVKVAIEKYHAVIIATGPGKN